jgi:hypothetical protein
MTTLWLAPKIRPNGSRSIFISRQTGGS